MLRIGCVPRSRFSGASQAPELRVTSVPRGAGSAASTECCPRFGATYREIGFSWTSTLEKWRDLQRSRLRSTRTTIAVDGGPLQGGEHPRQELHAWRNFSSDGAGGRQHCAWQFVHCVTHLLDQLTEPSPLRLRFLGVEPAPPTTVALASRCSGAATAVNAASPVRHRRRLAHGPPACPCAAPACVLRRLRRRIGCAILPVWLISWP